MRLNRIGLFAQSLFYIAGGLNHFWQQGMYLNIMPDHYSHPAALVQISGVAVICGGVGLLAPATRRGSQYACREYVGLLESHSMLPSMSRPANPYDNASCESFMRTLKREEIYANTCRDLENLRAHIGEFIERYYNRTRRSATCRRRSSKRLRPARPTVAARLA